MTRAIACAALALLLAPADATWSVTFTDVAAQAGLTAPSVYGGVDRKRFIVETNGAGVAFLDYDNDGWTDALVLNGVRLQDGTRHVVPYPSGETPVAHLYHNEKNGRFTDVSARAGLRASGWASSVCAGDYDNDGFLDVFVTYYGGNVLYRNRGNGTFEDVTARARLPAGGARWGSGCTFVDYDRDGRADLFVANYLVFDLATAAEAGAGPNCLWKGVPVNCGPRGLPADTNLLFHNGGDGTFADVSRASGVAAVTGRYSMTATAADFDGDGWLDIYVACDSTASILYRNNHDGTFRDVAVESGVAYSESGSQQAGMGIALADVNGDGRLDLLKTHFADDVPALYRSLGKGLFEDIAVASGVGVQNRYVEWGTGLPDFDNDGRADLMYVTGNVYPEVEAILKQYPHRSPRIVFRNVDGSHFEDVSDRSGGGASAAHSSRGAAFGDVDNDGDVDVLVFNMNEPPSLLRNDQRTGRHWIAVKLQGAPSDRAAIGATIKVIGGGLVQARAALSQSSYYSHDDLRLHFGLGSAARADSIEVRWPSGRIETLRDIAGDRVVTIQEGAGTIKR
jgi:hypothetical protein